MSPASWSLRRSGEEAGHGALIAGTALSDYYEPEYGLTNSDADAALGIIESWHEALNSGDIERLVTLSHPHVAVGGPHGTGHGTTLLQEWADRANIRLTPLRVFHRDDTVVVQQEVEWRSAETGLVTGRQTVASIFVVRDQQVRSVVRYADLTTLLQKANLDESDEVRVN
jgi:hypothetical protein